MLFTEALHKILKYIQNLYAELQLQLFFSIWDLFHEHLQFTGKQGKGVAISLTPLYHFHQFHRHLDISQAISKERSHCT